MRNFQASCHGLVLSGLDEVLNVNEARDLLIQICNQKCVYIYCQRERKKERKRDIYVCMPLIEREDGLNVRYTGFLMKY